MQLALAFILVRTIARLVQVSSGLGSALSQSQVYIVVLDGTLVLLAAVLLTLAPPGPAFGRAWGATSPSKRKAQRYLANLDLAQGGHRQRASLRSPSASYGYRLHEHESPYPSPQSFQIGSGSGSGNGFNGFNGYGYGHGHSHGRASHKREASTASSGGGADHTAHHQQPLPAYERAASDYAQVPYVPAPEAAVSLSQQYGQGRVVESQVVAPSRTDGTRTGGTGSGGSRTRTRGSPRVYEEDMVRHDAIW